MSWIFPGDSVGALRSNGHQVPPCKVSRGKRNADMCPLHSHLCNEQVMPSPASVQKTRLENQGMEQGRPKKSSNHHTHDQDLPDSSETQLLHDAQHAVASGPQPELNLETVGENPTWIAVEDLKALDRRNNPRVNCKSKSLAALRYNYIYIYIYVCIYIYVMYKRLSYQVPLNQLFKSTGNSSRYTCREAEVSMESLNTGSEGGNAATPL